MADLPPHIERELAALGVAPPPPELLTTRPAQPAQPFPWWKYGMECPH